MQGKPYHTLLIGTGFGGLCMAAKLKASGVDDFIVLEKAGEVGGTWRENTYPGAECDIASALYSYSFAPNPTWDFKWAKQAQILDYLRSFAKDRGLYAHIKFGQTVKACRYSKEHLCWFVETQQGQIFAAQFLVSAVGQLHHPRRPEILGADSFEGPQFHSAQWDHSVDLTAKRVAVLGNAASAVQLIPEIAKIAQEVTVYQRSANWIIPKFDRPYSGIEKFLARVVPGLAKAYRYGLWCLGEYFLWPMIQGRRGYQKIGRGLALWNIKRHIKDPALRAAMIPDYPIGAKRILLSDSFYPAMARSNVKLVTQGFDKMTKNAIIDKAGVARAHDVIVYATGFYANPFLMGIEVTGEDGQTLQSHWKNGAQAYLGVATAGFPNMFILYGPNTNTGHTSVVLSHEAQSDYILALMSMAGEGALAVKATEEAAFNVEMQDRLRALEWSAVEASWYMVGDKITNNWPGSSKEYTRRMKTPIAAHFDVKGR